MINALTGLGDFCNNLDRNTYIATVHTLFEELSKDTINSENGEQEDAQVSAAKVLEQHPRLSMPQVFNSMARLVDCNLLSYVNDETTVVLHSRKLKHMYKKLKNHPLVLSAKGQ
jgi:hypothetical protein